MKIEKHRLIFYKIPFCLVSGLLLTAIIIFGLLGLKNLVMEYLIIGLVFFDFIFFLLAGSIAKAECPECGKECICHMMWANSRERKYECKNCSFVKIINVFKIIK
jgi:hypothetical protein